MCHQSIEFNFASTLRGLKANKTTGLDKIPPKTLQLSTSIVALSLTYIFNLSLATGIYIDDWKRARVTPIFKSGDERQCANYRPISILPAVSYVFENWLIENKLQMHPFKSKLMFIGSSYNLNNKNTEQPVVVNNTPVSRTDTHKCLGVQIDEKLSWDSHIDMICKKASAGIGAMRRIKPFVPVDTLEKVYKSLVQPYLEYCSPLWDNCGKLLKDKLQRFQSRAARVLTGANYDIRSVDIIQALSWDTLDARRLRAKSTLMYKILNDDTAPNLRNSFVRRNVDQTDYHLRNSATDLTLPKPKREFLKPNFKYSGAMLWNQLPNETKLAESIYSFNKYIKT